MSTLEVEVKLKVGDTAGIVSRIAALGARLLHPREFEDNHLYDFPDRTLVKGGAMLRVRSTARMALLTYKDRGRSEGGVKYREEVEADLAPTKAAPLADILRRIGMMVVFRYQKYRTTWQVGDLLVTLDETPIGDFLELEGSREGIDALATRLGYRPVDYISLSYRDLYLAARPGGTGPDDRMIFPDRQPPQP